MDGTARATQFAWGHALVQKVIRGLDKIRVGWWGRWDEKGRRFGRKLSLVNDEPHRQRNDAQVGPRS